MRYNSSEVSSVFDQLFDEVMEVRGQGQSEYAHDHDEPFRNFEAIAKELGMTREEVLFVYFRKHVDGILSWIKGHKSQREDVRGRIVDSVCYLGLLAAMVGEDNGSRQVVGMKDNTGFVMDLTFRDWYDDGRGGDRTDPNDWNDEFPHLAPFKPIYAGEEDV